ncbi:unnamed protein product [Parajaminaea phylloscopi]
MKGPRASLSRTLAFWASLPAIARALDVTLSSHIQTCSSMEVTWDASTGTAPWTITVAPVGQLPVSVTVPAAYMTSRQWSWSWEVPDYPSSAQVLVAVSDSTGAVSGTSSLQRIATGTSSAACKAPASALDFVWYTSGGKSPSECGTMPVHWQVDSTNTGLVGAPQFVLLAEEQPPVQYAAGARDTVWNMPVPFKQGERFVIAAFDDGKSGTGGVGDLYTVGRKSGRCTSSAAAATPSAGLVAAKAIASPPASTPSAKTSPTTAASGTKAGASTTGAKSAAKPTGSHHSGKSATDSADSSASSSHGAAIAGGVLGCLAAAAIVVGLLLWWKRRKAGQGSASTWPPGDVVPWKWDVVADEKHGGPGGPGGPGSPIGAGAGALRRSSGSNYGPVGGPSSSFKVHSVQTPSQSPYVPGSPPTAFASATQPDMGHISKSSLSSRNIYSVVPDHALFPPPSQRDMRLDQGGASGLPQGPFVQGLERPPAAKVVPDSMLFPPPAPSTSSSASLGTPLGGVGAGVGTYAALQGAQPHERSLYPTPREQHQPQQPQQPSHSLANSRDGQQQMRSPVPSHARTVEGTSALHAPAPAPAPAPVPSSPGAVSYMPPLYPAATSIHDPYSHMSHFYNDPAMQARIAAFGPSEAAQTRSPQTRVPTIPEEYRGDANAATGPHTLASQGGAPRAAPDPRASRGTTGSGDGYNGILPYL